MGTSTMAPWEVNETTSPSIVLPTVNAATKLMKVKGSFTAGGGATRRFFFDWRDVVADGSLARASPFALTLCCATAFFVAACFLAPARAFPGSGGCSASSTASSSALEKTGSTLALPGGGVVGVMGHEVSTLEGAFSAALLDALAAFFAAFLAALANSAALAGAESGSRFDLASAVAARLLGPRMGRRGVKIQPTPGTGL